MTEQNLVDSYIAKAQEIGKDGCTGDGLVKALADYAFDNNHGMPGVEIAISLANRLIASGQIAASPEDIARAKENLNYKFDIPRRKR